MDLGVVSTSKFGVIGVTSECGTTVAAATKSAQKPGHSSGSAPPKPHGGVGEGKSAVATAPKAAAANAAAAAPAPAVVVVKKESRPWTEELQADYDRILSVGEECISAPELKTMLTVKGRGSDTPGFNLYDGFEPSGRMHIAQGVFKAMNVNKCTYPGTNAKFVFWVADWFALMNDKMGGDLDKIKTVGLYLIEVWKAAGMDLSNAVFKWASEEITNHADKYWPTMLDVARRFNITRIKKCCQIMGRLEGSLTAAQILYPLMQCTDVFFLKADICQLGVDQRKVNMLAREYCDAAGIKYKPIILSHHMLYGLKAGQEKMSKSDPDSAVFMEDAAIDVERKIMNAYCPNKANNEDNGGVVAAAAEETPNSTATTKPVVVDDAGKESMNLSNDTLKNPCLDYIQHIIFSPPGACFTAGETTYTDFISVRDAFLSGSLSEEQLKRGLIQELNRLLEPVRNHFTTNERAKDLLEKVQQYKKETLSVLSSVHRRLNLVELGRVKAGSHLVFAPLPVAAPTLQQAVDLLTQLRCNDDNDGNNTSDSRPRVLFLSDWSARVCNACQADTKVISAFYTILVESLRALDPGVMENTQILWQSEAILADPSNYWISVINVGRYFMLNDVMGSGMLDSDGVGGVISRLMRVADVAGVEPHSIALPGCRPNGDDSSKVEQELITKFLADKLPNIVMTPTITLVRGASLALQQSLKTDNDEYFLLDNPKVDGAPKMKKAFCEPLNIDFCPPLEFAKIFVFGPLTTTTVYTATTSKPWIIPRSGGGDNTNNNNDWIYSSIDQVQNDFASGVLHPSDLKPPLIKVAVEVMEKISTALLGNDVTKKAVSVLKNFQKKQKQQNKASGAAAATSSSSK